MNEAIKKNGEVVGNDYIDIYELVLFPFQDPYYRFFFLNNGY